jgi:hypothetical protein
LGSALAFPPPTRELVPPSLLDSVRLEETELFAFFFDISAETSTDGSTILPLEFGAFLPFFFPFFR